MRYRVGIAGWVIRVGIPGEYPASPPSAGEGPTDSEAGPEALQGLEWWSVGAGRDGGRGRLLHPPLRGPVGLGPSLVQDPCKCPPRTNKGEN